MGVCFGDYYYKSHSDTSKRGGSNQYTGIEKGRNAFQFRRIYLGYDYNINSKFSAQLLLAAEDDFSSGDVLTDNKLSQYIKLANLRWKNIWKGTDFIIGQMRTPAFPMLTELIWGYRSIERVVTDIRRTPSFDLGVALQGKFDPSKGNYGYDIMIGNGTAAKPENDKFKWFYGDIYAKLLDRKLIFDLYADYERLDWTTGFHHSRNMIKGCAAYSTSKITFGIEAFTNHGQQDVVGINNISKDTISANSIGVSVYTRGRISKEKLGFFARFDNYNPDTKYDNVKYSSYKGLSFNYEPNNKEIFITAGLDFTPASNIHFMPNIWYDRYTSQQKNLQRDYDLVYRFTFYYVFGR